MSIYSVYDNQRYRDRAVCTFDIATVFISHPVPQHADEPSSGVGPTRLPARGQCRTALIARRWPDSQPPAIAAPDLFACCIPSRRRRGRCPLISSALAHRQPRIPLEARIRLRLEAAPELAPARVALHARVAALGAEAHVRPLHGAPARNSAYST